MPDVAPEPQAAILRAWFLTSEEPGCYPLSSARAAGLRFGPPPEIAPPVGARRIDVEIEADGGMPGDDAPLAILRLHDPLLEGEALRLVEADGAGLSAGDLWFGLASIGFEGVQVVAFEHPERAESFLVEEAEMADGMGDHWLSMLDGMEPDGDTPPMVMIREDGPEVLDGLHRLAGHAVHRTPEIGVIVGVLPGRRLSEIPGLVLAASDAPERGPVPGAGGMAP